jgi:hypothetical protein
MRVGCGEVNVIKYSALAIWFTRIVALFYLTIFCRYTNLRCVRSDSFESECTMCQKFLAKGRYISGLSERVGRCMPLKVKNLVNLNPFTVTVDSPRVE